MKLARVWRGVRRRVKWWVRWRVRRAWARVRLARGRAPAWAGERREDGRRWWIHQHRRFRIMAVFAGLFVGAVAVSVLVQGIPEDPQAWWLLVVAAFVGLLGVIELLCDWLKLFDERFPVCTAKPGEHLVVIAKFAGPGDLYPQDLIYGRLVAELAERAEIRRHMKVARYPEVITGSTEAEEGKRAREVARNCRAALVIWGIQGGGHVRCRYEVTAPRGRVATRLEAPQVFSSECADLREFELRVQRGMPQAFAYMVEFTMGQVCYFAGDVEQAIGYFDSAGEKLESPEVGDVAYGASEGVLHLFRGNAYSDRIVGERAENLEEAIGHYGLALEVRTRAAFPQQWAMTQNNLGNAYALRIIGERAENLEEAIGHYGLALEVYTRAAFPEQWAMTQNNLGHAYRSRRVGERAENLEEAIGHYGLALEVCTRAAFPKMWAGIQNHLALAYAERGTACADKGEREGAMADLRRAAELAQNEMLRAAFGNMLKGLGEE